MTKHITVTTNDYSRLLKLIEFTSVGTHTADLTNRLYSQLKEAKTLPENAIKNTVVTMNSRVFLRSVNSERQTEITLTYPQDARSGERKVSVLSEAGVALLGREEKDIVSWMTPCGVGSFEITKVTYQPEAAGG